MAAKSKERTAPSTVEVDEGLVEKDQELDAIPIAKLNRLYCVDIVSDMKNNELEGEDVEVDFNDWMNAWVEFLDGDKVDPSQEDGGACFHIRNVEAYVEEVRYRRGLLQKQRSSVFDSASASDERLQVDDPYKTGARISAHKGVFIHLKIHDKLDPHAFPPGTVLGYADIASPSTCGETGNAQQLPNMHTAAHVSTNIIEEAAPSVGVVD